MTAPDATRVLYVIACGAGAAPHVGRLVEQAQQRDWDVRVIATPAAVDFLDVSALEAQTGHLIRSEHRRANDGRAHSLPDVDAIIVAPATYNTINRLAQGISDNYALCVLAEAIGLGIPVVVLPFVNAALAAHPSPSKPSCFAARASIPPGPNFPTTRHGTKTTPSPGFAPRHPTRTFAPRVTHRRCARLTPVPPAAIPAARRPDNEDERALVAALRRGEEAAFAELVGLYGASLLRLARTFVRDRAVAEEVVQETWLAVLNGIDRFEGRSSLKTWIFQILSNRAKTRAVRERRSAPFSSLIGDGEDEEAAVDADRFRPEGHRWVGHWAAAPADWSALPEERLLGRETLERVHEAIETLPPRQAEVLVLRDVAGWEPEEVCSALGISDGNQRILLHRARSKVRAALELYLAEGVAV